MSKGLGEIQSLVIYYVGRYPGGCFRDLIHLWASGIGYSAPAVSRAARTLIKRGLIKTTGSGKYLRYVLPQAGADLRRPT